MSLNIKNERTHALVRELAELTGMSQTSAVEDAVRRRLEELSAQAQPTARFSDAEIVRKKAAVRAIVDGFREETAPEQRQDMVDHSGLYDEQGLPA